MTKDEILGFVEQVGGEQVRSDFETWIETTQELPISEALGLMGLEIEYDKNLGLDFGFEPKFEEKEFL